MKQKMHKIVNIIFSFVLALSVLVGGTNLSLMDQAEATRTDSAIISATVTSSGDNYKIKIKFDRTKTWANTDWCNVKVGLVGGAMTNGGRGYKSQYNETHSLDRAINGYIELGTIYTHCGYKNNYGSIVEQTFEISQKALHAKFPVGSTVYIALATNGNPNGEDWKYTGCAFHGSNRTEDDFVCTVAAISNISSQFSLNLTLKKGANIAKVTGGGPYPKGTNVKATATPATGYHFLKWSNGSTKNPYSFSLTANTTLTAYAEANKYTVTYHGNGETSGEMENSNHVYATNQELNENAYTKLGYDFKGWTTVENPEIDADVLYTDKQSVKNLTTKNNGIVNLYAVWTPHDYTVALDGQGASNEYTTRINPVFDEVMPEIDVLPERIHTTTFDANQGSCDTSDVTTEHEFIGYFEHEDGNGNQYYDNLGNSLKKWDIPSDTTLYADWNLNSFDLPTNVTRSYKVHFNTDSSITVVDGDTNPTVICTFDGWYTEDKGGTLCESPYTPKKTATLYAHWIDNGALMPKVQKEGAVFIGWFTKPQTLDTLTDCTYAGGGIDTVVTIPADESQYVYGGGGVDWDYSTRISFGLDDGEVLELYPWFNQFPTQENAFSKYDDAVENESYDIIAYEGQTVSGNQLLSFVTVSDYEDDYYLSLENSSDLDEDLLNQTNAANLKLYIKSIQYFCDGENGSGVPYTVDYPTELETDTDNIGRFEITYELTDDGIIQYEDLHSEVTMTIKKQGYILYNNKPSVTTVARFLIPNDGSLTSENIEAYLSQGHTIIDPEDDINVLPYWISKTYDTLSDTEKQDYDAYNRLFTTIQDNAYTFTNVKDKLEDTITVINVSDISFETEYALNNPDIVTAWQQITDIVELYEYKETHNEEFAYIESFKIHLQVTDQFGKVNDSSSTTSEVFIVNENIDSNLLSNRVSEEIRYIDSNTAANLSENETSVWNSDYYKKVLNETFNNYENKNTLTPESYNAVFTNKIENNTVSIPVKINKY